MPKNEKEQTVQELVKLFSSYSVIGLADLENLPARQLQAMRESLRGTVIVRMAKKRLIKLALEETKGKEHLSELSGHMRGMAAVIASNDNPFKLYKFIDKNKSSAPAKAGQTAPKDIVVKAGKTNFAPGPIISELAKFGIKTGVEGGKLAIKQDVVVAKEGAAISAGLASVLQRLGVEPMEVGLNITAVYENGSVLPGKLLAVDESKYLADIAQAHRYALNLAVEAEIFNSQSTELLIAKASREGRSLSVEAAILTKETAGEILAKAARIASGVKTALQV